MLAGAASRVDVMMDHLFDSMNATMYLENGELDPERPFTPPAPPH